MNYASTSVSFSGLAMSTNQDKRALWDNSPELRQSVRDDLEEWGKAMRGGWPDLGYPKKQPFVKSDAVEFRYDVDKVQAMTDTFTLWRLAIRDIEDDYIMRKMLDLILTLRIHYISDRPIESKAKSMNISKSTFKRRLSESIYRFWFLHY